MDWHTDYYTGLKGIYFRRILKKIISIGKLRKTEKVLDFGCGTGQLKKMLGGKVVNYDVVSDLSEVKDWKTVDFDALVSNAVFHYMQPKELRTFMDDLYAKNKSAQMVVGLSKMSILNKIAMKLSGVTDAHDGKILNNKEVMEILRERFTILKKTSVFGMNEIFLMQFK